MTTRRIHLNAFEMNCVGHQSPGVWRHPDDQSHRYRDLDYRTELAKLLERGGFDRSLKLHCFLPTNGGGGRQVVSGGRGVEAASEVAS